MTMKRLTLSCLALAGSAACAQSTVTVFGIVDAAVTYTNADGAGRRVGVSSGGNAASRLGFRGTEDLGAGLSAGFWLEGAIGVDTGTGSAGGGFAFQRRATVSLASTTLGELRLGRDFAPTWWNVALFDPFNARGIASSQAFNNFGYNAVYSSNAVGYFLPKNLGGAYGQLQYAFGEKASNVPNSKQGDTLSGRLGYASGPLDVALAYSRFQQVIGPSDTAPVAIGRDLKLINFAASWNFGVVKPVVYYGQERVPGNPAGNNRLDSFVIGLTAPVGVGEIRASAGHHDLKGSANDFNKFALGYGYNLSKRTQLYAAATRLDNKGTGTRSLSADGLASVGAARPGGHANGVDLGLRHNF